LREWLKITIGVAAIVTLGAGPGLIYEGFRSLYPAEQPRYADVSDRAGEQHKTNEEHRGTRNPTPSTEPIGSIEAERQPDHDENKGDDDNPKTKAMWVSDAQGYSAIVVAFFTFVLAGVGWLQWRTYRDQAESTRRAADAALKNITYAFRPKLVVRRISLDRFEVGQDVKCQWIVANVGHAEAQIVESNATIIIKPDGALPPIPEYDAETDTMGGNPRTPILPGPGFPFFKYTPIEVPLTSDQFDAITTGNGGLFLIGYVVYEDDSGAETYGFRSEI
jgi:hypothetical protein